ncbi:uroporphyrinogen-III C-methyltransferase [Yersinia ruckeri]|uniref:uroporphyrinogen-III C-methyltransferase n=1 Tax=Yersinia ruckeri TaxID=29486 RepID=UPI002238019C|nr:uroporphyrinogen-III C-methyltransferase [Yersinia ruckeri]MCW6569056.1 uroporphyrinogen-III C-methyltransferase [Yersinia ruckeri]
MTEHTTPSAPVDETTTAVERPQQPVAKTPKNKGTGPILGTVAIAIAILLSGGLYYQGHQQNQQLQAVNQALQEQIAALKQSQSQEQQRLETRLQQQGKALDAADRQQASLARQIDELQGKVATISGSDAKAWLLAQADFLVKMAGRKLWSDQDVTSAATLLKSADASLADMNDPSLIEVRRAITEDIGTLSAVSQIDFDGIILKLNLLSNQVDNLRMADNVTDDAPMDEDSTELSGSLSDWKQNLSKSWHSFLTNFVTIRRRDSSAEPLLAPNQDIYLRENIRSRLLVAAQAVPRHQDEVYKQSLETISTWVRAYFDVNDPSTKAFLDELESLSQQSISMDVPDQLKSQPLLEKLMQTRVRNLLAQTPAANLEE